MAAVAKAELIMSPVDPDSVKETAGVALCAAATLGMLPLAPRAQAFARREAFGRAVATMVDLALGLPAVLISVYSYPGAET
eukprot:6879916-Alexandrium_andersonii.AAC.1